MRILGVSDIFPVPEHITGAHRRLRPIFRYLSDRHELYLSLLTEGPVEESLARNYFPGLAGFHCFTRVSRPGGLSRYIEPFLQFESPEFRNHLNHLLTHRDFDVLYFHGAGTARYGDQTRDIPCIIDTVDSISLYADRRVALARNLRERLAFISDVWAARRYERNFFPHFTGCFAVAPEDIRRIRESCPELCCHVVPVGVDIEYFQVTRTDPQEPVMIFSGKMDYPDNVNAAIFLTREVLPLVRQEIPEARLVLAGGNPVPEVNALAETPGVRVTGFVEDLREEYRKAAVCLAPLFSGAGIKCKVLEAMSMETPVVMTPLAAQGFENLTPGITRVVPDAASLAQAAVEIIRDPHKGRTMGKRAREYVSSGYSVEVVNRKVESILQRILEGHECH